MHIYLLKVRYTMSYTFGTIVELDVDALQVHY